MYLQYHQEVFLDPIQTHKRPWGIHGIHPRRVQFRKGSIRHPFSWSSRHRSTCRSLELFCLLPPFLPPSPSHSSGARKQYPHWADQGATLAQKPHASQVPVSLVKALLAQLLGSHEGHTLRVTALREAQSYSFCQVIG